MNSIKKKVQTDYPKSDILEEEMTRICYMVGFEKGANYVLEQIEQLVYEKHVEGNLPLFDLTHLIDNLKEK